MNFRTIKLIGLLIIIQAIMLYAGSFKFADNPWNTTSGQVIKYDKVEHVLCSELIYYNFKFLGMSSKKSLIATITCGFLWEIKDGLMPDTKWGRYGGDGFCWKDLTCDVFGSMIAYIIDINYKRGNIVFSFRSYVELDN